MTTDPDLQRAAERLFKSANGNPRRLSMLAAQFQAAAKERSTGGALWVVGGVSALTGKPFVQITWGQERAQAGVDDIRNFARDLIESAANATAEAAIFAWAQETLEVEREQAILMIDAIRHFRADRWGQPDLKLEFEQEAPDEP